MMSTKVVGVRTRARLRAVHEHIAIAGLIAIAAHGLLLLGDGWVGATPVDLVVPFTLGYRTVSTGLGVLAGWGRGALRAVVLRAQPDRRGALAARAPGELVVWLLGAAHVIGAGSDASTPFLRVLVVGSALPIGGLLAARFLERPGAPPPRPAAPPPAPAPVTLWSRPRA